MKPQDTSQQEALVNALTAGTVDSYYVYKFLYSNQYNPIIGR